MPAKNTARLSGAARSNFIEAIRGGQTRAQAAQDADLAYPEIADALDSDPAFRNKVQNAEAEAVRDALFEAAISGNIAAIAMFVDRAAVPEPAGPALTGIDAAVRRIALKHPSRRSAL